MSKKKTWTHKKFGKQTFTSFYVRDREGERNFVLYSQGKFRRITFESWQMAKKLGWKNK